MGRDFEPSINAIDFALWILYQRFEGEGQNCVSAEAVEVRLQLSCVIAECQVFAFFLDGLEQGAQFTTVAGVPQCVPVMAHYPIKWISHDVDQACLPIEKEEALWDALKKG